MAEDEGLALLVSLDETELDQTALVDAILALLASLDG